MLSILSWVAVLIGTVLAGFQIAEVHRYAASAPQQAAGAGLALAYVVIPYCFARAVESLARAAAGPEAPSSSRAVENGNAPTDDVASDIGAIVRPRYAAGAEGWRRLIADAEKQGWVASTTLGGVTFRHSEMGKEVKTSRIDDAVVALDLRM